MQKEWPESMEESGHSFPLILSEAHSRVILCKLSKEGLVTKGQWTFVMYGPVQQGKRVPHFGRQGSLLRLNRCGLVFREGDGGLLFVHVIGDGAVALVLAVYGDVHAQGEAHLQFVHALFGLVSSNSIPNVLGPVGVDGVQVVVEEEQEIGRAH